MDKERAESGLTWGFEIESLVLEILDDENVDEIYEDDLIEKLFQRRELQPFIAQCIEHVQKYPELAKMYNWKDYKYPKTARKELRALLRDVTDGPWHEVPKGGFGAHRKLTRWIIHDGNMEHHTITRAEDESQHIKRSKK